MILYTRIQIQIIDQIFDFINGLGRRSTDNLVNYTTNKNMDKV